jgi:hypothetical protein
MKKYKKQLLEMAFKKKDIIQTIHSFDHNIIEHILKILVFPEEKQEHTQWETHASSSIKKISKMKCKKNNYYLTANEYFKEFFDPYFENDDYNILDKFIDEIIFEYDGLKTDYTIKNYPKKEWMTLIKSFFRSISELISIENLHSSNLHELFNKYFMK